MSFEQNKNLETHSFAQQRLDLAFDTLERQSDVNADMKDLISHMDKDGKKSFFFDEQDLKSTAMPGGHAITWRYGVEFHDDPKDGQRRIRLTAIRFNDKITDGDEDTTVYSAKMNPFGGFDFERKSTLKRKLDFRGVKSEESVDYPIEGVEVIVAKLKEKYLNQK